ncbi:hypothetical protein J3E71DRAFT_265390, partial [Bipolaris maydis]
SIYGLNDSMDFIRKFVVKEHLVMCHGSELNEDELEKEIQIYTTLSTEVPREISVALESLGFSKLAEQSRAIGLYHPDTLDWLGEMLPRLHTGGSDCLRRTALHCLFDGIFEDNHHYLFLPKEDEYLTDDVSVWNSQDILGRTPLHILCQFIEDGLLIEFIQRVLELGPDLGLATVYRTIPLHHAAAMGSIGICKVLVGRGGEFDMGAEGFNQRTALDYAVIRKHQEVVDLLTDCYLEAGLNEKVAKAHRIAAAVRDGTYEYWRRYDY